MSNPFERDIAEYESAKMDYDFDKNLENMKKRESEKMVLEMLNKNKPILDNGEDVKVILDILKVKEITDEVIKELDKFISGMKEGESESAIENQEPLYDYHELD